MNRFLDWIEPWALILGYLAMSVGSLWVLAEISRDGNPTLPLALTAYVGVVTLHVRLERDGRRRK